MKFAKKVKKVIAKRSEEAREMELQAAGKLAEDLAECYAEVAETDISEESDDAVSEMVYRMFLDGRFEEALGLLMTIFELAERKTEAEKIRDLSPEYIEEYGGWIIKRFVRFTGMDPDPTEELRREDLEIADICVTA